MDKATGMKEAATAKGAELAESAPADVIAACYAFWQVWGTLPQPLAGLRRAALRSLRQQGAANGQPAAWIARKLGFSPNRFSRLTSASTEAAQA